MTKKALSRVMMVSAAIWLIAVGAAPAAETFAAGGWSHQIDTISADVPGVPQWMIKMFAGSRSRTSCLTPQQSATNPQALLTQDDEAKCRTTRFSLAGGKIDYIAICTNKHFSEPLTVVSTGTFSSGAYVMMSTATGTKKGQPVKVVTRSEGHRTGACK